MPVIKGRHTIRSSTASSTVGRKNRLIEPWILEAKAGTTTAQLELVYLNALAAVDKFGEHKAAAMKSGKFTSEGLKDEVLTFGLTQLIPAFYRGRQLIAAAKRELGELREKVKLAPPDKTDLVAAMRRQEMRSYLRGLPSDERNRVLARADNLDPETALAIVEMPAMYSGVMEVDRNQLVDAALQAQHGEDVPRIKELETAIATAESAVEAGREEIAHEVGIFDPTKFDALAADFEKGKIGPWLKTFREDGVERVRVFKLIGSGPGDGRWLEPSQQELADGEFYANHDAYAKAHAIAPV
jgi:hypothetical protein